MPRQEIKREASFFVNSSIVLFLFFLLADQTVKYFVVRYIELHQLIGNRFINITHYKNTGIAFGVPFPNVVLILLIAVIIGILIWYYRNSRQGVVFVGLSLVLSGAISNVIDRIIRDGVVDYISVFVWPTFNLADVWIALGVLLLAFHEFRKDK